MRPSARIRFKEAMCVAGVLAAIALDPLVWGVPLQQPPQTGLPDGDQPVNEHSERVLQTPSVETSLRQAASQLDDPSFDVRELASKTLLDRAVDMSQLYGLLAEDQLSPEQRYRLLAIVRDRLIHAPRGAIGIQMDGFPMAGAPAEIRVGALIPGLPAEKVLEIGDRIVAVDGRNLNNSEELITYVQQKPPGHKVILTIKRAQLNEKGDLVLNENNQVMLNTFEVELALGSAELLRQQEGRLGTQVSPVERQRAMEARNVTSNFAPQPKRISIDGAERMTVSMDRSTLGSQRNMRIDPAVERYWAIQALLLEQQMIRDGRRAEGPEVYQAWQRQLQYLMELAQQPDRTPDEQDLLMRIAERFGQLIDQHMEDRAAAAR